MIDEDDRAEADLGLSPQKEFLKALFWLAAIGLVWMPFSLGIALHRTSVTPQLLNVAVLLLALFWMYGWPYHFSKVLSVAQDRAAWLIRALVAFNLVFILYLIGGTLWLSTSMAQSGLDALMAQTGGELRSNYLQLTAVTRIPHVLFLALGTFGLLRRSAWAVGFLVAGASLLVLVYTGELAWALRLWEGGGRRFYMLPFMVSVAGKALPILHSIALAGMVWLNRQQFAAPSD